MALLLDGVPLPGYDQRVAAQGRLDREEQSGDGSGTGASHKGWKPWVIGVSCKVRFRDADDLAALRRLWQARTDAAGEISGAGFAVLGVQAGSAGVPKLYAVTDPLTTHLGVTHARFSDWMQVDPDERDRLWHVKLTLIEERSIPERTDERDAPATAVEPGTPDGTADSSGAEDATPPPDGWLGKVLAAGEKFATRFFPDL